MRVRSIVLAVLSAVTRGDERDRRRRRDVSRPRRPPARTVRRQERPLLVIHAGPHKTGTTAAQQSLLRCAGWLRDTFGVDSLTGTATRHAVTGARNPPDGANHNFPYSFRDRAAPGFKDRILKSPHANFYGNFFDDTAYDDTWRRLRDCEAKAARNESCAAIISSEGFTEWPAPDLWTAFLRELGPAWRVRVALLHRNPAGRTASAVAEGAESYVGRARGISLYEALAKELVETDRQNALLDRVLAAFGEACGPRGPSCRVVGASYDALDADAAATPYNWLALNATLGLRGAAWAEAAGALARMGCDAAARANRSPDHALVAASIIRMALGLRRARGCDAPLRLHIKSPGVVALATSGRLPVMCFDASPAFATQTKRWHARVGRRRPTPPPARTLCDVKESAMRSEHWAAILGLVPDGECS